jgi:hypothetical protein
VIYDGLTARAGVAKVYWEEKFKDTEETFEGLDDEAPWRWRRRTTSDEFEAPRTRPTALFSGTLTRKKDCSKVSIDPMAPEEFLIEPSGHQHLQLLTYVGHRTPKTKAELIEMGYDKKSSSWPCRPTTPRS